MANCMQTPLARPSAARPAPGRPPVRTHMGFETAPMQHAPLPRTRIARVAVGEADVVERQAHVAPLAPEDATVLLGVQHAQPSQGGAQALAAAGKGTPYGEWVGGWVGE